MLTSPYLKTFQLMIAKEALYTVCRCNLYELLNCAIILKEAFFTVHVIIFYKNAAYFGQGKQ